MNETLTPCPICHGEGTYHEGGPYLPPGGCDFPCDVCGGKKKIPMDLKMAWVRSHKIAEIIKSTSNQ